MQIYYICSNLTLGVQKGASPIVSFRCRFVLMLFCASSWDLLCLPMSPWPRKPNKGTKLVCRDYLEIYHCLLLISFGKSRFKPAAICDQPFVTTASLILTYCYVTFFTTNLWKDCITIIIKSYASLYMYTFCKSYYYADFSIVWFAIPMLINLEDSMDLLMDLINYIETKAKCRHLKKLTCKRTLRQVFVCLRPTPLLGFGVI